jgi:CheY-like chemotaxis protein
VIGFADLLRATSLDRQQKEFVDAINDGAKRLVAVIDDARGGENARETTAAAENPPRLLRSLSVLVVEDDSLSRKLMDILLRRMNCEVDMAKNGHEAILKASTKKFDVILMDIQMPLMDGLEATEFLRTHMQNETPIIALTAKASREDDRKCIMAGMNDFLSKPVEFGLLQNKILKWTEKK